VSFRPRTHRGALAVLLLALVVRIAYLGLYYQHTRSPAAERLFRAMTPSTWDQFQGDLDHDQLFSDQIGYARIAHNLLAGRGYRLVEDGPPTAFRAPVYPLFLAAVFATGGNAYLRVRLLQLVMELGTVLLLLAISRRVFRSEAAALAGAGLYAVYVPMVLYSTTLFSETVYTFLLALFVWLLVRAREAAATAAAPAGGGPRPGGRGFFGAGLALGVVTLTKPTTLLLPFFLLLPILLQRGLASWRERAAAWRRGIGRELVPVALGMCLVLAPWTVRNAVVLGEFVPVSTGGGRILWGCNTIPADDPMIPGASHSAATDVPQSDRGFYMRALANIAAHPGDFVHSSLVRLVRLWFNLGFDRPPSGASLVIGATNLIMVLLLLAALLFARGPWTARAWPLFLLLVYFSLVHMVLEGYIRYALPVVPYLMLAAAYGAVALVTRGRTRMVKT
jgi:hypothetical protein